MQYKLSFCYAIAKCWRVLDGVTGVEVENAKIIVKSAFYVQKTINKGNGFYIALNLIAGKYQGIVYHKDYEKKEFTFDIDKEMVSKIEVLLLNPVGMIKINEGQEYKGTARKGEQYYAYKKFYYGTLEKIYTRCIIADAKKNQNFIAMNFTQTDNFSYRKIALEKGKQIYTLSAYDFLKKGYFTDLPLGTTAVMGSSIILLNECVTNEIGEFYLILQHTSFEGQKADLFFYLLKINVIN